MPAKTVARGYGYTHEKLRRALLAAFTPGQPCARCGHPIHHTDDADLGHSDDRATYLGLEHTKCNRAAGGRHGRKRQLRRSKIIQRSRRW